MSSWAGGSEQLRTAERKGFRGSFSAEIVPKGCIGAVGGWAEKPIHCHSGKPEWSAIEETDASLLSLSFPLISLHSQ
jgi:hypothetical protein